MLARGRASGSQIFADADADGADVAHGAMFDAIALSAFDIAAAAAAALEGQSVERDEGCASDRHERRVEDRHLDPRALDRSRRQEIEDAGVAIDAVFAWLVDLLQ